MEPLVEYCTRVSTLLNKALEGLDLTDKERHAMEHVALSEGIDTVELICNVINKAKLYG